MNNNATKETLTALAEKLITQGVDAHIVSTGVEAKNLLLTLIPTDAEVMTMTSITLQTIGALEALEDRGQKMVRTKLMDASVDPVVKRQLGAAPEVSIASAHAVTENGEIVIVSGTGSQLPAVVYGAGTAILVVGHQKIVKDMDEAMKRIYEYVLPLESERANKAYNITTGSSVNKILIIKKEAQKGRIKVIFVEESLGF